MKKNTKPEPIARLRAPSSQFYVIPQATFDKLRLHILADVAWDKAGEPMWDCLANDVCSPFDEDDLHAVRYAHDEPLSAEQLKKIGNRSHQII